MPERCDFELERRTRAEDSSDEGSEKVKPLNMPAYYRSAENLQQNQTPRVFGTHLHS